MKPLDRYSKRYQLARLWVKFTLGKLFLRRVEIRGLDKIDPKKPIILAPNHQNALLDALLTTTSLKQQPVFLARADIFEKDFFCAVLRWMRMLPVYRIRDGYDSLKKNEDIFDQCVNYLGTKNTLILFPEGDHSDKRHLRPLKKGLARIAFEAEKKHGCELGLQIIPVGIDYSDYRKFRGRATIIIGDPIEMKSLQESFNENPQKGIRKLNLRIQEGIEPHMIEIPWMEFYDDILNIRTVYIERFHSKSEGSEDSLLSHFDSHKKLISILGEWIKKDKGKIEKITSKVKVYFKTLKKLNLRDHVINNAPYSSLELVLKSIVMIICLPLYLYGVVNNYIIFKIPDYFTIKKIKDTQFRSSIAYVLAFMVLLPLLYTIQTILVAVFTTGWWIPLLYLASLIPAGLFAIHYSFWYKKIVARWKFNILKSKKNQDLLNLIDLRKTIVDSLDEITAGSASL